MDETKVEILKEEKTPRYNFLLNAVLIIGLVVVGSYYLFGSPVRSKDATLHFKNSDSLSTISKELEKNNIIRHPFVFKGIIYTLSLDRHIPAGDYLFKKDESFYRVILQVLRGEHGVEPIRITIKEGMTNEDITKLLADKISGFRKDLFVSDPKVKQGYLFPDTYFFFSLSTTDEIVNEITADFNKRISSLRNDINKSGKSLDEIITMASILEKEASGKDDIYVISGILWKRIKLGMLLQADAAPTTYKQSGLPDNPISNPGLLAIKAALNPKESPYLFYLHDDNGGVHYAVDFSQHRSNIAKYLK